jgi:hypothetical protein
MLFGPTAGGGGSERRARAEGTSGGHERRARAEGVSARSGTVRENMVVRRTVRSLRGSRSITVLRTSWEGRWHLDEELQRRHR